VNLNAIARFAQKLPGQGRPIFLTCIYGLVAALAAVAFQLSITVVYSGTLVPLSHQSTAVFLVGSFLVLTGSTLGVGFLLTRFCKDAAGSGIPQLKLSFWKDFGYVPFRVVWVKFVAGVLSIGGGSALGREGPSVHVAGGAASNVAGLLGEPKQNRRMAAAAGAAAGLAAAFNTPLAAITFVLEEIIADLNSRLLGGVLLASVIGAFVVHGIVGPQPAFQLHGVAAPNWIVYVLTPVVAAAASLAGVVFHKATLGLRQRQKRFKLVPAWMRPAIGGVITWMLGASVFLKTGHLGVFGLGYGDLSDGLAHKLDWQTAGLLLGTKLVAIIACYGLGGCGGIFSPMLFLGGMCGICLAGLGNLLVPMSAPDQLALAVVGMSACLGAVVRAPVTGILIVFEMTHEFSLVPALMIGALVSQAIGLKLMKHSFYEEILIQDGHVLANLIPPRDLQGWQQWPVSAMANFHPVVISDPDPARLIEAVRSHPYQRFPVLKDGGLEGTVSRKEAEAAWKEKRPPKLDKAVTCLPQATIADLQALLIESSSLMVIMVEKKDGKILGLITLHDLLRAEAAYAKAGG
jgi:CIC family chloride channel protein